MASGNFLKLKTRGNWTPLALGSDLLAWWSADYGLTLSGSQVASWVDRKNGHTVTQTGAAQPTYSATSFNGAPGLTFDGTDDCLVLTPSPFPSGASPSMLWAVVQQDTAAGSAGNRQICAYGDGGNTRRAIARTVSGGVNRALAFAGTGSSESTVTGTSIDLSSRHLVFATFGASATTLTADCAASGQVALALGGTSTARFRIGAISNSTATGFFQGVIRDILVTNELTADKTNLTREYLLRRRKL